MFWLFTESDFGTFVIPNTAFGIVGALAGPVLTTNDTISFSVGFLRLPRVLMWNWLNLAVFDLANQRLPDSAKEDQCNKPWRPVPAGYITLTQVRRLLLFALPAVLAATFLLGAWEETALLFVLTWMYNDLLGGEEHFLLRNAIIAVAFSLYNGASLRLACGREAVVHGVGYCWLIIISAVIFSTMHIQDLKDVVGDEARKRKSAPLVLGNGVARWTIAVPCVAWSILCPLFLGVGPMTIIPLTGLGAYIAFRTIWLRDSRADRLSWYFWAGWLICLYTVPLIRAYTVAPTIENES